jgi:uncharacterized protein YjiS (DUF1127 family)
MLRNDGIGGTPRLFRYGSFCLDEGPTPGRPSLPRRTPGETDPDTDSRFQLTGARAVAPAPEGSGRSPELERSIRDANETARSHIPNRTTGECTPCGQAEHPCRPFKRAMTILDRWDPSSAKRIRTVLHLSGLTDGALDDA